ncbi:Trihelix transcription factor ASR3 [Ananas comosus]|uniref:Trihelix transcription factor ASR3 n=1 Tax=Ananas comosus TaxID=4615 RepID=A0A199UXX2_ANACO|nr:Trihelix transcription factor ASR3 [Ananas comosus]
MQQHQQQSDPLCVVQALEATTKKKTTTTTKTKGETLASPSHGPGGSSSRCTRSQAAPNWTTHETLALVNEVAALDEAWSKSLSSYQKWKIVSDSCAESGVVRASNQCKRRWESILGEYRRIRRWECRNGVGSYWGLDGGRRKGLGLPVSFDREVFDSMDAVIKVDEAHPGPGNSDSEELIGNPGGSEAPVAAADAVDAEMADAGTDADEDLDSDDETNVKPQSNPEKAQELAIMLQENAQHIHSILKRELTENPSPDRPRADLPRPNSAEVEFVRRQADELIKTFGGLVSNLNQFCDLIKDGGYDGIISMN